jgi:hypothetical protein
MGKVAQLQPELPFGFSHRVDDLFRRSLRALEDVYDQAGNLVVAGATGIDKADLPKMFEPGGSRHFRYKAAFQIGALHVASPELRRRVMEPLAECWGFGLCEPEPMSDREARVRLEAKLEALGPVGKQALAEVYGGRR